MSERERLADKLGFEQWDNEIVARFALERIEALEDALRPFAGAYRRNKDSESAALRAFRAGQVVYLDLPLGHFARAAELVLPNT